MNMLALFSTVTTDNTTHFHYHHSLHSMLMVCLRLSVCVVKARGHHHRVCIRVWHTYIHTFTCNFTIFQDYGAHLEIITDKSQEGSQFCSGFGGIGGLLRYVVVSPFVCLACTVKKKKKNTLQFLASPLRPPWSFAIDDLPV